MDWTSVSGTVLVVEDDPAGRELLGMGLGVEGFDVVAVPCGADVRPAMAGRAVDVVVLDLTLPDASGFEVLRWLKADPATRSIPVLIVSGRAGTAECITGLAEGAHDVVRKPYDLDELVARVSAATVLKRRLDALHAEAESLTELALTDALTGLDNRRAAEQHLERLSAQAARSGQPLGVLLADVDRFKALNDRHGHATGDRVLREVAARLRATARQADVVARWGGEEFIVLLPDTDAEAATLAARRLCAAVSGLPVDLGADPAVAVTISVGAAASSPPEPDLLVAAADTALYEAKRAGRNRVVAAVRAADAALRGLGSAARSLRPEPQAQGA